MFKRFINGFVKRVRGKKKGVKNTNSEHAIRTIRKWGVAQLWKWTKTLFDDKAFDEMAKKGAWQDYNMLSKIDGDITTGQVRWYADIATQQNKLSYIKMKVGQAQSMSCATLSGLARLYGGVHQHVRLSWFQMCDRRAENLQ